MKNIGFTERLNLALDKEGFPPKNKGRIQLLAEIMGLTHRGASKWINGETCPPTKKYADLAKKLNVNEQWLMSGRGSMTDINHEKGLHSLSPPITIPLYKIDEIEITEKVPIQLINCDLPIKNGFAIKLETEAMSPRFPLGSIIIFDVDRVIKDGDFILVKKNDYPAPIFRQLLKCGGTSNYLNAHNPKFDRLLLLDSDKTLGVMIQAILSFI